MFPSKEHIFDTKEEREILGQRLELARLRSGLSQLDALEKCGLIVRTSREGYFTGVTKGFLTYVEKGHRGVTKDQVVALAKLYKVSQPWLTSTAPMTRDEIAELIKLRSKITRGRKPSKLVPTIKMPPAPAYSHHLTVGDQAVLNAISACSEPEKLWLTEAIDKLIKKIRQPVST